MSDGANQGILAHRALETILGDEPAPTEDEGMSREQMRAAIEAAAASPAEFDYNNASLGIAKYMLGMIEAHPEIKDAPISSDYSWPDGWNAPAVITVKGWDTWFKELDPDGYQAMLDTYGPTGFMYGWAANAVRYVLDLPPAPNPAIVEITVPEAAS